MPERESGTELEIVPSLAEPSGAKIERAEQSDEIRGALAVHGFSAFELTTREEWAVITARHG